MKGYPKHVNCKQDFLNLLADENHREQAIEGLKEIYSLDDSKTLRATTLIDPEDPKSDYNTEEIDNPMPVWMAKGFESREEVATIVTENGGAL